MCNRLFSYLFVYRKRKNIFSCNILDINIVLINRDAFQSEVSGMERFMGLYNTVYQDMYRFAYYYLGNPQDAEDVVGEAVLKAYEKFRSLKNEDAFKSWIFKILVNQCNSFLRKNIKNKTYGLSEEPSYQMAFGDRMIVQEMLSELSEDERKIVALAVFGEYRGEDIARMLHMRHSTVRSKYRRALKKLENKILDEEVQHE